MILGKEGQQQMHILQKTAKPSIAECVLHGGSQETHVIRKIYIQAL